MSIKNDYYGYSSVDFNNCDDLIVQCESLCKDPSSESFYKFMSNRIMPIYQSIEDLPYDSEELASSIVDRLESDSFENILNNIEQVNLVPSEIPLINTISTIDVVLRNLTVKKTATYLEVGEMISNPLSKKTAILKMGEINSKLMSLFGFVELRLSVTPRTVSITPFGVYYIGMEWRRRTELIRKLILKIPVISYILNAARYDQVLVEDIMNKAGLNGSTIERRKTSIKKLLKELKKTDDKVINDLCMNVVV